MKITFFILLILYFNCLDCKKVKVLYLSDIHLDLYYDSYGFPDKNQCKYYDNNNENVNFTLIQQDLGKLGCDSNVNLLNKILNETKKHTYDFVIINGDSINHLLNKDKKNLEKNYINHLEYLNSALKSLNSTILYSFGNNDFSSRYQGLKNSSEHNKELFQIRKTLFIINNEKKDIKETIKFNGLINLNDINNDYYTFFGNTWYSYSFNSLTFIFLDSVLFSFKRIETEEDKYRIKAQFNFLNNELEKVYILNSVIPDNNQKVIMNYHIPPFLNYYRENFENNWKKEYIEKYFEIVSKYKDLIILTVCSHYHYANISVNFEKLKKRNLRNEYGFNSTNTNNIDKSVVIKNHLIETYTFYGFTYQIPGVSPSNFSKSGFSIVTIDDNMINDIESFILEELNPDSNFYHISFKKSGFEEISSNSIFNFINKLSKNIENVEGWSLISGVNFKDMSDVLIYYNVKDKKYLYYKLISMMSVTDDSLSFFGILKNDSYRFDDSNSDNKTTTNNTYGNDDLLNLSRIIENKFEGLINLSVYIVNYKISFLLLYLILLFY